MVSIGVIFLMGVLGLVVDLGWGYYQKQIAQAAADSAALAGAGAAGTSITCGSGNVLCESSATACNSSTITGSASSNLYKACQYATANGVTSSQVSLTANTTSPRSGAAVDYWVSATVSIPMVPTFLQVVGMRSATAAASATGAVVGSPSAGGCIYVLDGSGTAAMNVSGSEVLSSNCGIYVNSTSSNALLSSGGATTTASVVDVVGGVNISGGSTITPTPTTGVSPKADPLSALPAPTFGGCNFTSKNISATTTSVTPGVYCGGITISGGANVTFGSGSYILNGGGLNVSGNSTITGNGVFFYNTSSGYAFGPIQISGDAGVTLTAPTSGTYQGILFFQDRSINSSSSSTVSGGATANISGSVYLPTAGLYFSGGSSTAPLTMAFVVKDLNVSGSAYLEKDATGALTGMGTVSVALVQ